MERASAGKLRLDRWVESVVSGIAAREKRITAIAGHFERIQQRAVVWHFGVDLIVMEVHFPVWQGADSFSVFTNIGYHHDIRQEPCIALGEEFRWPRQRCDLAEISCHAQQIFL